MPIASPFVPVLAGELVPELRTARENTHVAEVVEHDAHVLGVGFNVVKPLERASGLGPGRQGIGRS